jgi:hypothetical protein
LVPTVAEWVVRRLESVSQSGRYPLIIKDLRSDYETDRGGGGKDRPDGRVCWPSFRNMVDRVCGLRVCAVFTKRSPGLVGRCRWGCSLRESVGVVRKK